VAFGRFGFVCWQFFSVFGVLNNPLRIFPFFSSQKGLVTASTEGRVNYWSLGNLREPVESLEVGESISCFAVAPESGTLLLGDEHGALHSISTSGGQRARKQVRKMESTDAEGDNFGHYGMVTSISTKVLKPGSSLRTAGLSRGFLRGTGGLVLTSGVDWTTKLWSPAYSDTPLLSFVSHSYDYMCDAKWSPVHPSLFATASSNGTVGLWNIAKSLEEPMTGKDGVVVEPNVGERGLNKLQWSNDGRRLAVASGDLLHILNLTEDMARPKGDEDITVMNQLLARGLITKQ
jgi:dynein intermediate chain